MDRSRKKESVVKVKVPKDYSFRDEIWNVVDTCCERGLVPDCSLPYSNDRAKRDTKGKVKSTNPISLWGKLYFDLFFVSLGIIQA